MSEEDDEPQKKLLSKEEQLMESRGQDEGGARLDVKVKKSGHKSARVEHMREVQQRPYTEEHADIVVSQFLIGREEAVLQLKQHNDDLQATLRHLLQ